MELPKEMLSELSEQLSIEELAEVESYINSVADPITSVDAESVEAEKVEEDHRDIRARIGDMTLPEKIKLAMFGDGTCRSILILDSNRIVPTFVLKNPKLQLSEVESFAANPNLSDAVLRQIGEGREWIKSYAVKLGLTTNPKTPPDMAIRWLRHLMKNDLKRIAKSKNVPQLIAITAKKWLQGKAG